MNKYKYSSIFLTIIVLVLLLVAGPASAITIGLDRIDGGTSDVVVGDLLEYSAVLDIHSNEVININQISILINNQTCLFTTSGVPISSNLRECDSINISSIESNSIFSNSSGFGYGYGLDSNHKWGYNNLSWGNGFTYTSGYGYDNYTTKYFGYGYDYLAKSGVSGEFIIYFSINTSFLSSDDYEIKAGVLANDGASEFTYYNKVSDFFNLNNSLQTSINGSCSSVKNTCKTGTYSDLNDTSDYYRWKCLGVNGGVDSGVCRKLKTHGSSSNKHSTISEVSSSNYVEDSDSRNDVYHRVSSREEKDIKEKLGLLDGSVIEKVVRDLRDIELTSSDIESILLSNLTKSTKNSLNEILSMMKEGNLESVKIKKKVEILKITKSDGTTDYKTRISINLDGLEGTVSIIEVIPKEYATDVSLITFSVSPEIIEKDPVVKWIVNATSVKEINYFVNGEVPMDIESKSISGIKLINFDDDILNKQTSEYSTSTKTQNLKEVKGLMFWTWIVMILVVLGLLLSVIFSKRSHY